MMNRESARGMGVLVFGMGFGLLAAVGACTSMSKYDERKQDLKKDEQKQLDEFRAELEIGRNMAGRLLAAYGTQEDTGLVGYVNQVASYVGGFSDHPDKRYMVEILDTDFKNAFACPGGYILVTKGALKHAEDEAELAGILAHEIAHVGYKHMFDKLKNMSAEELEKANALAKQKNLPPSVKMRARPKGESSELASLAAKYLAGGSAGLSIVKAAGAGMAVMMDQGLGAEKEYEADGHGIRFAVGAGYDPQGLNRYLCRLKGKAKGSDCVLKASKKKGKKKSKEPESILDKTHPPVEERIANINKVLATMDVASIVGANGKKRFNRYKKQM